MLFRVIAKNVGDVFLRQTVHFIYILVLEDVIGSDVGGRFLLAHPVVLLPAISAYVCYMFNKDRSFNQST